MSDSSTAPIAAPPASASTESSPSPDGPKAEASPAASQGTAMDQPPGTEGSEGPRKRRRRRRRGGKRAEGAAGTPRDTDTPSLSRGQGSSDSPRDTDTSSPSRGQDSSDSPRHSDTARTSRGQRRADTPRDTDTPSPSRGQDSIPAVLTPAVPADQPLPSRPPRERRRRSRREDLGSELDGRTPDGPIVRESSDTERPSAAAAKDDGSPADIDPSRLDAEGLKILNRLHRFEHQAYFVGGCVRDLLLGRPPKDFDIATSAHPGEVRSLFRNCRLIGRRFRLAHLFFRGGKLVEVATFRANPAEVEGGEDVPDDLLITRDNVFGTAEQDARRRDFTVNGLFYDVRQGRVIDHVSGLPDLATRTIRTIGDPEVRLREDPVRILRAVRFASRLDFEIDPSTYAAMEGAVEDLPRCAPARLLEEVLRLMRSGYSRRSFELLYALGAMRVLLPPVADHLDRASPETASAFWARLGALDARLRQGPIDDSIIIAVMLHPLARAMPDTGAEDVSLGEAVDTLLDQMVQTARLPRRMSDRARLLLWAEGVLSGERRRRRSLASFRRHPIFTDALALFEIGTEATGVGKDLVEQWKAGQVPTVIEKQREADQQQGGGAGGGAGGRKRRRRRRGRGNGGGPRDDGPAAPPAPGEASSS